MDWQGWFSLGLVAAVLVTLIVSQIGPHLVVTAALVILSLAGILDSQEALAGFSNSGLITVAALFVVAAGIHASGGIDLLVQHLLGRPKGVRRAQLRIAGPTILLSAFLNNTPVVATMIPAIHAWSRRIGISASKLMIPLSYASILGGTLTLIGTSTNLVVNSQYQLLTGTDGFSLFSITLIGLPVALIGLTFMLCFFPRWLPDHRPDENLSANLREFTLEVAVAPDGPLVGKTIAEAGLRNLKRVYLAEIERNGNIVTAVPTEEKLRANDRLIFAGDTEAISDLLRIRGIVPSTEEGATALSQSHPERRLVEVVVSPHCDGIGHTIRDTRFRDRYGAVVLAVARNGERVKGGLGQITLEAGDTLLLEARPAFVNRQRYNKDFLLVNELDSVQPRHEKGLLAWVILLLLVTAAGTGLTSMLNAALAGAAAMLLSGCCTPAQAQRSLDFTVLLTIAASFALGAALQKTGAALYLAENVVSLSGGHPWLMLVLTYATVSLMTESITNNAAALIMLPIVIGMAQAAGLNYEPFVFAVMMAASASFATPLGYQTNLMVYGPGGYRFTEFLKVGIPMNLVTGLATVVLIPFIWPLSS